MKTHFILFVSILLNCSILFAQYDAGTEIYSATGSSNFGALQKNYKVVDFDNDQLVDILLIKEDNLNQLTWYKGDGSGNFTEQANLLEVKYNHLENEIFYADMNEDGIEDVVFQNDSMGFTILYSSGEGIVTSQKNQQLTFDDVTGADLKELADVDGDGDMDGIFFVKTDSLGFFDQSLGHCLIAYNDGSGSFSNYTYLDDDDFSIYYQVETGDIDGDGDVDIVCNGERFFFNPDLISIGYIRYFFPFIRIYKNTGINSYAAKEEIDLPDRTYFVNIKLQDLNNGGNDELLVEKTYSNVQQCEDDTHLTGCETIKEFEILKYQTQNEKFVSLEQFDFWLHNYTFDKETSYATELQKDAFHIQFGNQNTDNNLDILSINVPQQKLQWHLGDGNGSFNDTQAVNVNNQYSNTRPSLRTADIDNDNDLDIFVLLNDSISSTLTVFKNETPVGIEDKDLEVGKLNITPNPVKGNTYVQLILAQNQNLSKATYNLYAVNGSKLITGNLKENRIFIPALSSGIYLAEINLKNKKYIEKIIVN